MLNSKLSLSLVAILLTLAPQFVRAGGSDSGGGGKGILCGTVLRSADLYEAEVVRRWKLTPAESTLEENLATFGPRLGYHQSESRTDKTSPDLREFFRSSFKEVLMSQFRWTAAGERLPLTSDATLPRLNEGCREVQVLIYQPNGSIDADTEYWAMLDSREQSAMLLHEWTYKRARRYGALDSDESRYVIGMLYSTSNPEPMLAPLWSASERLFCGAGGGDNHGEIYELFGRNEARKGVSGLAIYIRAMKSEYFMTRTTGFIPNAEIKDFTSGKDISFDVELINTVRKQKWQLEIRTVTKHGRRVPTFLIPDRNGRRPPPSNTVCRIEK